MSYTEWLYDELVNDGFIDESEYEADELTKSLILQKLMKTTSITTQSSSKNTVTAGEKLLIGISRTSR